jgi:hypothetical protein
MAENDDPDSPMTVEDAVSSAWGRYREVASPIISIFMDGNSQNIRALRSSGVSGVKIPARCSTPGSSFGRHIGFLVFMGAAGLIRSPHITFRTAESLF